MTEPAQVPEAITWGEPDPNEFVKMGVLQGHLLIVHVIDYIPHIQTKFTQAGKKSDAIQVDIIDLNMNGEDGQPGKVYRRQNWMSGPVIGALKGAIGGAPRLGVLSQGVATMGNPPWLFTSMTSNPDAVAAANAWASAHADFKPSEPQPHPVTPPPAPPQPQQYQQGPQPGQWQGQPQQPYGQVQPGGWGAPPPQQQQQQQWNPQQSQQPAHWGAPEAQPQWSQPAPQQYPVPAAQPINTQGWGQPPQQPSWNPAGQPAPSWQPQQSPVQQQLPPPPPPPAPVQQQAPSMLQQMQAAAAQGPQPGPTQEQAGTGF